MTDREEQYAVWRTDAEVLAEIGAALAGQALTVRVQIAGSLAQRAVAAWERDDSDVDELIVDESSTERLVRRRAGALALIGLALTDLGATDYEAPVTAEIGAWQVGTSLDAAEDYGTLPEASSEP